MFFYKKLYRVNRKIKTHSIDEMCGWFVTINNSLTTNISKNNVIEMK